jgi:2-oxoglutarate ferredoxin oxidoreductase subunit alpha
MATREVISTGNDLAAIAAVDAGCTFFGGYPITPSSEVMHTISDLLPAVGGTAIKWKMKLPVLLLQLVLVWQV